MREYEVNVLPESNLSAAEQIIESSCSSAGLQVTLKGTLGKYPGCVHWHYKKENEPGTLEITLWPKKRRAWLSVQSRRTGEWMDEVIPALKRTIESDINQM